MVCALRLCFPLSGAGRGPFRCRRTTPGAWVRSSCPGAGFRCRGRGRGAGPRANRQKIRTREPNRDPPIELNVGFAIGAAHVRRYRTQNRHTPNKNGYLSDAGRQVHATIWLRKGCPNVGGPLFWLQIMEDCLCLCYDCVENRHTPCRFCAIYDGVSIWFSVTVSKMLFIFLA